MTDHHVAPVRLDPSNAEQLAAWDGAEGAFWAANADRFDRSIAVHHAPFMAAAAIGADDRVLDVGCGTGQATREAARAASSGSALGIDLSTAMLDHAARRAAEEGLRNVTFVHGDVQVHRFEPASATVAIARTSAMFFGDPVAAFGNIRRCLGHDGRIVLLTWQPLAANEWLTEIAGALAAGRTPMLPPPGTGPFALSEQERVSSLLRAAGFTDVRFEGIQGPMWFGDETDEAWRFILGVSGWMVRDLDPQGRAAAHEGLRRTVERHLGPDGVTFESGTWISTARAATSAR